MSQRREFSRKVKAEIILRATKDGRTFCEECGVLCKPGQFDIDHTTPDALQIDKSKRLTAEDGRLLCNAVCHPVKTADDVAKISKAVRLEQDRLGVKSQPSKEIESASFPPVDKSTRRTTQSAKAASEKLAGLGPGNIARRFRDTSQEPQP